MNFFTDDPVRPIRLTVVIPTYNEAENIPLMAAELLQLPLPQLQLLVVDDNSPDGTGDVCDQLCRQYNDDRNNNGDRNNNDTTSDAKDSVTTSQRRKRFDVLHRQGKGGLGTAYVAGMTKALEDGADFVVQMDADFSHSPAYILQMLGVALATDASVVVGSRYVPGGSLDERWEISRRLLSAWANLYTRVVLRLRIRDMTAGFKLWKRQALLDIGLDRIRSNGYSFQVEMAFLSEKLGFHIIEIPIHFEDRRIGRSKMDIPVKLESAWRTWQVRWRYRNLKRRDSSDVSQTHSIGIGE